MVLCLGRLVAWSEGGPSLRRYPGVGPEGSGVPRANAPSAGDVLVMLAPALADCLAAAVALASIMHRVAKGDVTDWSAVATDTALLADQLSAHILTVGPVAEAVRQLGAES